MNGERQSDNLGELPRFCSRRGCSDCRPVQHPELRQEQRLGASERARKRQRRRARLEATRVAAAGLDGDSRKVLKQIFAGSKEFCSGGFFRSAVAARRGIAKRKPRLLVIEIALAEACGVWLARELLNTHQGLDVILVTAIKHPLLMDCAARVGIRDILIRPFTMGVCLARLRFALSRSRRERLQGPGNAAGQARNAKAPQQRGPRLGATATKIMALLERGLQYKEIATEIGRSEASVRRVIYRTYEKLRKHNRTEAVLAWHEMGG